MSSHAALTIKHEDRQARDVKGRFVKKEKSNE